MDFQKKDWQFRDLITEGELNRIEDGIEEGITKAEQAQDTADNVQNAIDNHIAATTGVHGATSAATPNTLVQRDSGGSIKAANVDAVGDIRLENGRGVYGKDTNGAYQVIGAVNNSNIVLLGDADIETNIRGTNVKINGNTAWHAGNDGAGSGLDADTVDGYQASQLVRSANHHQVFLRWDEDGVLHVDVDASKDLGVANARYATYLGGFHADEYVRKAVSLPNGSSLNAVVESGFYRLGIGHLDAPPGVDHGQMIVSRGGDTILQIVTGYSNNEFYIRHGNPPEAGNPNGTWQPWRKLWHDGNDGAGSGLDADLLRGMQPSVAGIPNSVVTRDQEGWSGFGGVHVVKDQNGGLTFMLVENLDQRLRLGSYYQAGVAQFSLIDAHNDADQAMELRLNNNGGRVVIGGPTRVVGNLTAESGYLQVGADWGSKTIYNFQGQMSTDGATYFDILHKGNFPYETGFWTPELRFDGQNTGITYAFRAGRYTRIANVVYWSFTIILSSKGSASGLATIAGLPFSSRESIWHAVGRANNISVPSGQWLSSVVSGTTVNLITNADSFLTGAAFANNSGLDASGFYFI